MYDGKRFYVRRIECWGRTWVYTVRDKQTWTDVTKATANERTADRQCAKRNADWETFLRRRGSKFAQPAARMRAANPLLQHSFFTSLQGEA